MPSTLFEALAVRKDSSKPAIIIPGGPQLTYPQYFAAIRGLQLKLAQLGLPEHAAISIAIPNTIEFAVAFLGVALSPEECVLNYKLKADDVIVMMTDGVYDSSADYSDPDEYFADLLGNMKINSAQETAQKIMDAALKNIKKPKDDMLVFVAIVRKN